MTFLVAAAITSSATAEAVTWRADPSVLSCTPRQLNSDAILVISLGKRHGKEMAIQRQSDGIWYMLVLGAAPTEMRELMSPEQFSGAAKVRIASTTTGYRWTKNQQNERIFTSPGKYTVYVSDNLETETSGHKCEATYAGKHAG